MAFGKSACQYAKKMADAIEEPVSGGKIIRPAYPGVMEKPKKLFT